MAMNHWWLIFGCICAIMVDNAKGHKLKGDKCLDIIKGVLAYGHGNHHVGE